MVEWFHAIVAGQGEMLSIREIIGVFIEDDHCNCEQVKKCVRKKKKGNFKIKYCTPWIFGTFKDTFN